MYLDLAEQQIAYWAARSRDGGGGESGGGKMSPRALAAKFGGQVMSGGPRGD